MGERNDTAGASRWARGGPRLRPAGYLRPFVASYIDFDMAGWPPGRHRGLPGGTLVLVVSVGGPLIDRRAGQADLRVAATIAGLRSSPVDILHDGTQCGVQLGLTPRGARALLGLPAAALAQGVWPLDEVVGGRAHELAERLADAPGPRSEPGFSIAFLLGGQTTPVIQQWSMAPGAGSPARPARSR
jgi:hypothetical protein